MQVGKGINPGKKDATKNEMYMYSAAVDLDGCKCRDWRWDGGVCLGSCRAFGGGLQEVLRNASPVPSPSHSSLSPALPPQSADYKGRWMLCCDLS